MNVFYRPGQGFKTFTIKKLGKAITADRKVKNGVYVKIGDIKGILATATEDEKETWKQKGHPITHKIVQHGVQYVANATNYLVLSEKGKKDRYFYVQGTGNPAELNHMMRYFVEERDDLKDA